MKPNLTKRQEQIFNFIKQSVLEKGYPPSVREIGAAVGLNSSATVHSHLNSLENKGLIRRDPTKPRAIEILDDSFQSVVDAVPVPVVGRVTAGAPILAVENIEEYFPLPRQVIRDQEVFILQVRGDSMIEAGILDGDYVLVRRQNFADNGDIVVALLGEEATVKTFYKEKNHIRLQPENSALSPILTQNVTVLGKVIGVFRLF
ncbi:MAG TPA: transcriptional repressor LexA [Firmicutes bacterium]|nr:transcriptional repressor LexA [Bacillota bacterium]